MLNNKIKIEFCAISENESFARSAVSLYVLKLNPSVAEVGDVKTAVSEAVTNAIVHGYPNGLGKILLEMETIENTLHISVIDYGVGISDINQALEPFYTTRPNDERSGMGFTIMKSFMDDVRVESVKGKGTRIYMSKKIQNNNKEYNV